MSSGPNYRLVFDLTLVFALIAAGSGVSGEAGIQTWLVLAIMVVGVGRENESTFPTARVLRTEARR